MSATKRPAFESSRLCRPHFHHSSTLQVSFRMIFLMVIMVVRHNSGTTLFSLDAFDDSDDAMMMMEDSSS